MLNITLGIVLTLWILWEIITQRVFNARELGRFADDSRGFFNEIVHAFERFLTHIGIHLIKKNEEKKKRSKAEQEMSRKLQKAGLESPASLGGFFMLRIVCLAMAATLSMCAYQRFTPYYATVSTIVVCALALIIPRAWLHRKIQRRSEDVQRELPLLVDMTNLGTSAGWDIAASLERVIDTLAPEYPNHPLLKEYQKARWLVSAGYTWEEALSRVSRKIDLDVVKRCNLAFIQALSHGGDRTSQLQGISEDAQRTYYTALDRRLAGLPVKAVLLAMVLLFSYLTLLMAPAAVQISKTRLPTSVETQK
jgi:pilus assembly protein TadC